MNNKTPFLLMLALLPIGCARVYSEAPFDGSEAAVTAQADEPQTTCMEVLLSEELCELVEKELATGSPGTKAAPLNGICAEMGIVAMERIFPYDEEFEECTRAEGLHRFYRMTLSSPVSGTKASSSLMEIAGIEAATPQRPVKINSFNDPYLSRQWDFINDGTLGSNFSKGCDINVRLVWEQFTTGDPSVIVSVVDGGIDYNHPDLAGNYVGGYNFCRHNTNVTAHSHGTHVAGTVAAINNNGIGVCGTAGGDYAAGQKGVGLLSCQIFDNEVSGGSGAEAIKWGADHGAVISQNSWGFDFKNDEEAINAADMGLAAYSPSLKAAIDYFIKTAGCKDGKQRADSPMKGGVYISSAGNDQRSRDVIGEYEPVIAVGAVAPNFNRAYYSNYGTWVDICAPGGDAGMGTPTQVYSTMPGGSYGYYQGTSMACPHVSGVAALLVSYFGGQGFTNDMLVEKLLGGANAEVMEKTNQRGNIGPLLDAFGAITYGGVIPPAEVAGFTVTPKSNNLDFAWQVTKGADGMTAYGYLLLAAKDASLLTGLNPSQPLPEGVTGVKVFTESLKPGQTMTGRITDLEFNTAYYTAIAGFNSNNYYSGVTDSSGSDVSSHTPSATQTGGNNAPTFKIKGESSITLKAHESGEMYFSVSDPDDHKVTVSFDGGSAAASCKSEDGVNYTVSINAPAADEGDFIAKVTASDKYGASASIDFSYTILENHAPEKVRDVDNILMSRIGETVTLDMEDYISDPDGETLRYSASLSTSTNLNIKQTEGTIELRATNFGETVVTMKGSDVKGKYCSLSFIVLARDPSTPIDVYPNPVIDVLTVRPGADAPAATVEVFSQTGALVRSETGDVSPFNPFKLSLSSIAPGKYVVRISFGGQSYERTIVKQ